jgi:hypothetical protein
MVEQAAVTQHVHAKDITELPEPLQEPFVVLRLGEHRPPLVAPIHHVVVRTRQAGGVGGIEERIALAPHGQAHREAPGGRHRRESRAAGGPGVEDRLLCYGKGANARRGE